MEKTEFIVQIQVQGNTVDKVISIGVSPDEFENINRAEKIGMKLIKRVEIIRETTLVSQIEQRVALEQPSAQTQQPPATVVTPPQPFSMTETKPVNEPAKFGKPTVVQQPESKFSDEEIDNMIKKPNEVKS